MSTLAQALTPAKLGTLGAALASAQSFWEGKGDSSRMMGIRAAKCVALAGGGGVKLSTLKPSSGAALLTELRKSYSKGSVASYYAAFRRMLALSDVATAAWPTAGAAPRKVREPIAADDLALLREKLGRMWTRGRDHGRGTIALLDLLRGTGMRVDVEALTEGAFTWFPETKHLKIIGKGGHERCIPVADEGTIAVLGSASALRDIRLITYEGHLARWKRATIAARISSKLPTPHAVRHLYATQAWQRCRDLKVVQELLGHADVSTTARYIGVDMAALRTGVEG